ncbi:MAG: glycosyltransferase family 4 protein [Caldisericia bacterium]|nr:glycosyltransferase family 4 protein [Caldisericia bacterium]
MYKVGVFISGGEKGGSRYQVMTIAKELKEKIEFVFFNFYEGELYSDIKKENFKNYLFKGKFEINNIKEKVLQEKLDLIHTYGFRGNFYGRIISKLTKIKSISTYTSFMNEDYESVLKGIFLEKIDDLTLKIPEKIIVSSSSLKEYIKKRGYKKEIKVIHLGIEDNLDFYKKEDFGLNENDFVIGTVMRLERVKNPIFLIEVFNEILKKEKNAKLVIVGDGSLKEKVLSKIDELNLKDYVKLLGFRKDARKIYGIFDIFVLPSIKEGFSIVTLEAMASSLPVVVYNSLGVREMVEDVINGFILKELDKKEFAEKILLFLYKEKREELGKINREKVLNYFKKDDMVLNTLKVYEEVIR